MFEKILEKLLIQNAGQFVEGIDKENLHLGIWSGEILIQNVRVKSSVLDMLELPFKMKYSHIGRLRLKVPWKNLGSAPVELQLEDVFVVISPLSNKQWEPIDFKNVQARMDLIESFITEFTNKIREAQKQQDPNQKKQEQGYVAKLTEKIVDNLQISITNIHIRVENIVSARHYAFGITLDELQVHTANGNWDKQFIDRTDEKYKLLPLRKKVQLKNLGIYWNANTQLVLSDMSHEKITNKMKELVLKDDETHDELSYLISISADSKLVQKNPKDVATKDDPNFNVELTLQPLNLNLQKMQLEDIIGLLEYLNGYNTFKVNCMRKREEENKHFSEEDRRNHIESFRKLFEKIQRNEKKDDFKGEEKIKQTLNDPEDVKTFKFLLQAVPDEDLAVVVKDIVKTLEIERKKQEIEDKNTTKGVFGFFKKPKPNATINQEEMSKIESFLDETLHSDSNEDIVNQAAGQKTLVLNFLLQGGNVSLFDKSATNTIEGVNFGYKELRAAIELRNKGQKVQVSLKEISLALKTKYQGTKDYVLTPILQKLDGSSDKSKPFMTLDFEQDPIGQEEGTYISLVSQSVELIYRPVAIERLVSFFNVTTTDEALKTSAREQLEKAQDQAGKAANQALAATSKAKKKISVKMASPIVVIPFLQNADIKGACWVMQLGDLLVDTTDPIEQEQFYDIYNISLSRINYKYYPSQEIYIKAQESLLKNDNKVVLQDADLNEYNNVFSVLEDFSIVLNVKMVSAALKDLAKGKAQMDIDMNISGIHLRLKPQIYNFLVRMPEILAYSKETAMELQENDRRSLMQGMEKMGRLFYREKKYNDTVWSSYFVIVKGGYMYFFKGPTDVRPSFSIYIRSGKVTPSNDLNKEGAFIFESRTKTAYLAAENVKDTDDWIDLINKKINEYASTTNTFKKSLEEENKQQTPTTPETEAPKNYDEISMAVKVVLKQLKLTIYHNDTDKLIDLRTNLFSVGLTQRPGDMDVLLKLHSLEMRDYLYQYVNPNLKEFLTSAVPESYDQSDSSVEKIDLFEVALKTMAKDHPQYESNNKTDLDVKLKFGYLFLNLKPDLIESLLTFLTANLPKESTSKAQTKPELKSQSSSTIQGVEDNAIAKKREIIYSQTDNILVKLQVEMKQMGVRMVHRKLRCCLAEFSLKDASISVILKPHSTYFHGKLGNILLIDTTNYPYTIDSNVDYQKIRPYEILGVGEKDVSLIEIEFKSFDPQSNGGDLEKRIFSYVDIKIRSIRLNLLMQPLMRLTDFFTTQVLGALNSGNKSQALVDETTNELIIPDSVKLSKWQSEDTVTNPNFMDIKLRVESPVITVKPLPESTEWIEVRLGDITITNDRSKNTTRYKNPAKILHFVYCEVMRININDMGIWKVQGDRRSEITRNFTFSLDLERQLFPEEYQIVYGENNDRFELDTGMVINARMTPLIVILSKDDYKMLMKVLNYNITYSDGLDDLFLYTPPKTEAPVLVRQESKIKTPAEQSKASPIHFELKLQNIGLVILEETSALPITMININLVQVMFEKDEDGNTTVELLTHEINGSVFEKQENELSQRNLLGSLARESKYTVHSDPQQTVKEIVDYVEAFTSDLLKRNLNSKEFVLQFKLEMTASGDKNITVSMAHFRTYLITSTYLSLANFTALDDSVNPPPPKTELRQVQELETIVKPPTSSNGLQVQTNPSAAHPMPSPPAQAFTSLNVRVTLKNIIVTMPSTTQKTDFAPQVLTFRGDIGVVLENLPAPSLEDAKKHWNNRTWKNIIDQATQDNKTMKIIVSLNQFEIFISELDDLVNTENFSQVRKRNIILPFSLLMLRESYGILDTSRSKIVTYNRTKVDLDKLALRVSYNDVKLLYSSLAYQLEQLSANSTETATDVKDKIGQEVTKALELPAPTEEVQSSTVFNKSKGGVVFEESKTTTDEDVNADFDEFIISNQGIQLSLINDTHNVLVPVLEATIAELGIGVIKLADKMEVKGKVVFGCTFFNPRSGHWEPIIERFGLDYEFRTGERIQPKTSILLQTNEDFFDLNINISDQMIETLYSTSVSWKTDIAKTKQEIKQKKSTDESKKDEDYIEYVSPYIIKNSTGYPIEIVKDDDQEEEKTADPRSKKSPQKSKFENRVFACESGSTVSYLVEFDVDRLFVQNQLDYQLHSHKIKLNVKHNKFNITPIDGVDIDSTQTARYPLQGATQDGKNISMENYFLIYQASFVDNKKMLTVCSPIQIRNNLSISLRLKMENNGDVYEPILASNQVLAVPFDFISKGFLTVMNAENPSISGPRNQILSYTVTDKKYNQITVGDSNYIVKPTRDGDITYLEFDPSFIIKNCCPVSINYQVFSTGSKVYSGTLKSQANNEVYTLSRANKVIMKVRTQGLGWSSDSMIYSDNPEQIVDRVSIKSVEGTTLTLNVLTVPDERGSFKIILYCKAMIINETLQDLIYYACDDKKENIRSLLPGQNPVSAQDDFNPKVALYGDMKRLAIARKSVPTAFSPPFAIGAVGEQTVVLEDLKNNKAYEFGVNMSLVTADKDNFLFTNIITISPRYIILNKLKQNLAVKKLQDTDSTTLIQPDQRTPFEWNNYNATQRSNKQVSLKIIDEDNKDKWVWTGTFDIAAVGIVNVLARSADKSETKFLRASITLEASIIFVEIEEQDPASTSLRIQNDVPGIDIVFYQTCSRASDGFKISDVGSAPYAWQNPSERREVFVDFQHGGKVNYHSASNKYSFDALHRIIETVFPISKQQELKIHSSTAIQGNTRVLRFYPAEEDVSKRKKTEEVAELAFQVKLTGVGISLISTMKKKKSEVLYICIKGIEVAMLNTNVMQAYQLRVKYINIDNNSYIGAVFPVLFTPTSPKELLNPTSKDQFIDISIVQNPNSKEIPYFNYIKVLFSGITLRIDGSFIESILTMQKDISDIFERYQTYDDLSIAQTLLAKNMESEKENLKVKDYFENKIYWKKAIIQESHNNIFIEELQVQPIFLNISFHLKGQSQDDKKEGGFFILKVLTNVLGSALANVDEAPLNLKGVQLQNVFDERQAIVSKLANKYKDEGIRQVFKILGSIDILGNPVGLFNNISTGVVDLFEKPIHGFNQGPLEGGYGIVLGAGSLVKNTISGTFNSINKVTGSLAGGLSSLTMDDEYIAQREKAKLERPKDLVEGLGQGLKSLYTGVEKGLFGVFTKPFEGAKKAGVKGFFVGTWQGVSGLVVKPVTGVLDAASKTSEGIKNTATYFDEKANTNRQRYPRPFYGTEQFYRPYLVTDAEVLYLLQLYNHGQYANISLLYTFDFFPNPNNKDDYYVLVLAAEVVLYWSSKKGKIVWEFPARDLEKADIARDSIVIHLKIPSKTITDKSVVIVSTNKAENKMVVQKLNELKISNAQK